jgi:chromosome segregation ATPase
VSLNANRTTYPPKHALLSEVSVDDLMTDDGIQQILLEIRAVGESTTDITTRLDAIEAQLASLPTSADVEELRAIVHELQADMNKIKDFVEGDPPLKDRLIALEDNVAAFKKRTGESEAQIAQEAGTADDSDHRASSRAQADEAVGESEARQEVVNVGFRDRISELFGITGGLQAASLRLFGILCLVGSIIIYVLARALGA